MGQTLEPAEALLGKTIANKFEILELIGEGGMGRVYRATHLTLRKAVAVKVLLKDDAADGSQRAARFHREALAASQLDHPNCLRILDFGQSEEGHLYIVMELLSGEDLREVLKREGVLSVTRVCGIMRQVLGALAEAHDKGIIHRDIKPGNIMLTHRRELAGAETESVKVLDFGLAKIMSAAPNPDDQLTQRGVFIGTPTYMSPEQAKGEPLDHRSDIYACGVIMYQMLSGRVPFTADTSWGVLMKHISEPAKPLAVLLPDLDPRMSALITWAMAKDREQRCQNAFDLLRGLQAIFDSPSAPPPTMVDVSRFGDPSRYAAPTLADAGPLALTRPVAGRPERAISNAPQRPVFPGGFTGSPLSVPLALPEAPDRPNTRVLGAVAALEAPPGDPHPSWMAQTFVPEEAPRPLNPPLGFLEPRPPATDLPVKVAPAHPMPKVLLPALPARPGSLSRLPHEQTNPKSLAEMRKKPRLTASSLLTFLLSAVVVIAVATMVIAATQRTRARAELAEAMDARQYSNAETFFLKNFDRLHLDTEALAMMGQAVRLRRETVRPELGFEPDYLLMPGVWEGTTHSPSSPIGEEFRLVIEDVGPDTFTGTTEWPGSAASARFVGFHDGNQLVWKDSKTVRGVARHFTFQQKKVAYVSGRRMRGTDGSYGATIQGTKTGDL